MLKGFNTQHMMGFDLTQHKKCITNELANVFFPGNVDTFSHFLLRFSELSNLQAVGSPRCLSSYCIFVLPASMMALESRCKRPCYSHKSCAEYTNLNTEVDFSVISQTTFSKMMEEFLNWKDEKSFVRSTCVIPRGQTFRHVQAEFPVCAFPLLIVATKTTFGMPLSLAFSGSASDTIALNYGQKQLIFSKNGFILSTVDLSLSTARSQNAPPSLLSNVQHKSETMTTFCDFTNLKLEFARLSVNRFDPVVTKRIVPKLLLSVKNNAEQRTELIGMPESISLLCKMLFTFWKHDKISESIGRILVALCEHDAEHKRSGIAIVASTLKELHVRRIFPAIGMHAMKTNHSGIMETFCRLRTLYSKWGGVRIVKNKEMKSIAVRGLYNFAISMDQFKSNPSVVCAVAEGLQTFLVGDNDIKLRFGDINGIQIVLGAMEANLREESVIAQGCQILNSAGEVLFTRSVSFAAFRDQLCTVLINCLAIFPHSALVAEGAISVLIKVASLGSEECKTLLQNGVSPVIEKVQSSQNGNLSVQSAANQLTCMIEYESNSQGSPVSICETTETRARSRKKQGRSGKEARIRAERSRTAVAVRMTRRRPNEGNRTSPAMLSTDAIESQALNEKYYNLDN